VAGDDVEPVLADRLNELFRVSRPRGRPWTNDEVAAGIKRTNPAIKVSGAYLSALRNGKRRQPSRDLLTALAKFFGVSPAYFFDSGQADRISQQLAALDELRQAGVRGLALRAVGLPAESLSVVNAVLDQMRKLQGLPPVDEQERDREEEDER
jgi:transcriptional regulator with XRE-family HTH domain